ncbi:hypothetical protein LCGC14_0224410 [marine sediment metagenome]|uniref:Uncharacterized protein n=1 Tax=marine sediment metagenome TaxID=412755 RepID=A0A0F9UTR2_9ZZZZ
MNNMSEKKENKTSYTNIFKKCATTEGLGSDNFEKCCDNELNKDSNIVLKTAENIMKAVIGKNKTEDKPKSNANI